MYDSDIKIYSQYFKEKSDKFPYIIIGTCNPYFPKIFEKFPVILHLEKSYYQKHEIPNIAKFSIPELLSKYGESGIKKIISQIVKTDEKLILEPNFKILEQIRDGKSSDEIFVNNWIFRMHFKEMIWFFLSTFSQMMKQKTGQIYKICASESKFCEMYLENNGSKAIKLYEKFIKTKTYQNFISTGSFCQLFN